MSNIFTVLLIILLVFSMSCSNVQTQNNTRVSSAAAKTVSAEEIPKIKNSAKIIHVMVALCDNENQGIVPVPAFLGDGEDPAKNLYWGAAFGVKTFFGKSKQWEKVFTVQDPKENVLERIVFKNKTENVYLIADAYRGSKMKDTITDFFGAVSGAKLENLTIADQTLQIMGSANLVAFVGHNGLMDFKLEDPFEKKDNEKRDAVILACLSKSYFARHLKKTSAEPLLWTSNLMAPEAYILHDALEGWINGETSEEIRDRAAAAYAKYQRISLRSAQNLLVTGW